ncbi:MAG: hypothetical protein JJE05_07560 [Actinobacteria bacterium]|nr:hypothetical protein [Actinomycetota bacterium]
MELLSVLRNNCLPGVVLVTAVWLCELLKDKKLNEVFKRRPITLPSYWEVQTLHLHMAGSVRAFEELLPRFRLDGNVEMSDRVVLLVSLVVVVKKRFLIVGIQIKGVPACSDC